MQQALASSVPDQVRDLDGASRRAPVEAPHAIGLLSNQTTDVNPPLISGTEYTQEFRHMGLVMKYRAKGHTAIGEPAAQNTDHVLRRREILARERVVDKYHININQIRARRLNALYVRQSFFRLLLIVIGLGVVAILARFTNNTIYFVTGTDYHILSGLLN